MKWFITSNHTEGSYIVSTEGHAIYIVSFSGEISIVLSYPSALEQDNVVLFRGKTEKSTSEIYHIIGNFLSSGKFNIFSFEKFGLQE